MTEENNTNKDKPNGEFTEEDPLQEETKVNRSCRETFAYVRRNITVEPTLGLFVLGYVMKWLTTQNLSIEKACRVNFNFTAEICDSLKLQTLGNQNVYEMQIQKFLSTLLAYKTYISATIPCLFIVLVSWFTDKTGRRKIFLIIPVIGQLLICLNNIINVYFFHQLRLEVLIFSEAVLEGLSGGICLIAVTAFAFISAITTNKERTFRMGVLSLCFTLGFPVGMGLSGVLLKNAGYYASYGLAACFDLINLIYSICSLKDPKRSIEQKLHANRERRNICNFFVFTNNYRRRICVMLLIISILFGPLFGEMSILYLSTRYRFNWDEVNFGTFQAYNSITHTIGKLISITVFSRRLQWHDSILGIISTTSKIASSFIFCFAPNGKIFYLAPLVDMFNGTALLAMRSILSKLVSPDEFGKVNSIFGMTENLMPLLYVPLYTTVYKSTMEVLPGAVFLMGAAMTLPALVFFIYTCYEHKKQVRLQKDKETELMELNGKQTLS